MAFLRHYAAQGDPFPKRIMRAGKLGSRTAGGFAFRRARSMRMSPGVRRLVAAGGDPFRFRMPKFIRKLQPGKILKSVAKVAIPLAGTLLPGVGGAIAGLASGFLGGGAPPDTGTFAPEPTGTPGEIAGGRAFSDYPRGLYTDEDAAQGYDEADELTFDDQGDELYADTLSEDED